jgi:hypothetical protein
MFIRFRVHEPKDTSLDPSREYARKAYAGGPVRVFHRSVKKTRSMFLRKLVSVTSVPYLVRVVGIGHESGVLTVDLR